MAQEEEEEAEEGEGEPREECPEDGKHTAGPGEHSNGPGGGEHQGRQGLPASQAQIHPDAKTLFGAQRPHHPAHSRLLGQSTPLISSSTTPKFQS